MSEMEGLSVTACRHCPELCGSRSQIVNGVGPSDADILFAGEAPGKAEDQDGEPFVGRSGEVLDEVLRDNGLARADVRITNCVRCRPPDNRDPRVSELANCFSYLTAEIRQVDPVVLVTLGKVPAEHLLDRSVRVTDEAGDVVETVIGERSRSLLLSVHPAATLYDRSQRATFERAIEKAAAMAGAGDQETLDKY